MSIGIHGSGGGGGGGGTPADPSEVNVIEYGSVATTLGQKAMAASIPITVASNQSTIPVDGSGVTQPISAATLPLPTGAATAALQTQPGVDIGDVTINNAAGAAAVNIQDGGNSITVDGSVSFTTLPFATRADTFTTTGNGVTVDRQTSPLKSYSVQVKGTGAAATTWDVRLEGSLDNMNFVQILQHTNITGDGNIIWSGASLAPSLYFRSRVAGLTLGAATNIVVTILGKD